MDGTFPAAKKGGVSMTKESGGFDQIDQWKSTMFLYSSALKSINTKIEILNNEFIQLYNYNPIEHITSRLKTPESIVKKLKNDGCEVTIENMVEHLNDIAGIRIICSFMSDIYPIADMIARQADITVLHVLTDNPLLGPQRRYRLNQITILRSTLKLHPVRHVFHLGLKLINDFIIMTV